LKRADPNAPAGVCFNARIVAAVSLLVFDQIFGERTNDSMPARIDFCRSASDISALSQ